MKVEISESRTYVVVNGRQWAKIERQSRGSKGAVFFLLQLRDLGDGRQMTTGGRIKTTSKRADGVDFEMTALVNSAGRLTRGEVDDKIVEMVQELVQAGRLRDPAVIALEHQDAARKRQEDDDRLAARKLKTLQDRARTLMVDHLPTNLLSQLERDLLMVAIVEAMQWAQDQREIGRL